MKKAIIVVALLLSSIVITGVIGIIVDGGNLFGKLLIWLICGFWGVLCGYYFNSKRWYYFGIFGFILTLAYLTGFTLG